MRLPWGTCSSSVLPLPDPRVRGFAVVDLESAATRGAELLRTERVRLKDENTHLGGVLHGEPRSVHPHRDLIETAPVVVAECDLVFGQHLRPPPCLRCARRP